MRSGLKHSLLAVILFSLLTGCGEEESRVVKTVAEAPAPVPPSVPSVPEKQTEVIIKEIVVEKPYIPPKEEPKKRMIRAFGYVRGSSAWTIKNKYAGYVTKVNFYSQQLVKKGDVILEYDNKTWRDSMEAKQNEVKNLEQELALKQLQLELKKLDPIPSNYRNIQWKMTAAKEKLDKLKNEMDVYNSLHSDSIISHLTYREKAEEFTSSKAEYESALNDWEVVKNGLGKLYVSIAGQEVETVRTKLEGKKRELALLEEEGKHYKVVAEHDGICVNNYDTVGGYLPALSSAAAVHTHKKLVYCYMPEKDMHHVIPNKIYTFRSLQHADQKYEVKLYDIDGRTVYGDTSYFLLKGILQNEPKKLEINSQGWIEMEVQDL